MGQRVLRYLTPLVAAAGLLIGGAVQYAEAQTVTGIAMLTAGILTLGVWIGVEVSKRIPEDAAPGEDADDAPR
jgi:hypothetical protein